MEKQNNTDIQEITDFEIYPYESINIDKRSVQKLELSTDQKTQMHFLASQLPDILASEAISQSRSKIYVMHFPKGLSGELMQYKKGGVSNIVRGTDGKIIGHAPLYEISTATTVFQIFSITSLASGQYFLSEINENLNIINQKIDKIIDFLYGEKKAELVSEISFAQYAYKNFSSIMSNEPHKIATLSNLQEGRKIAIKDIEFYLSDLETRTYQSTKSYSEFEDLVTECFQIKNSLELSIQLYILSSIMEIYYSQNNTPNYIEAMKNDMIYYVNKCEKRILSVFGKLNGFNDAFKPNPLKKIDTRLLNEKIMGVINMLSIGEDSSLKKIIDSALEPFFHDITCYLTTDGDIYIPCS